MGDHQFVAEMSGHCLCGAVQFTARDVEVHHHVCHCTMCRRWVGGPIFAAMVKEVIFENEDTIKTYSSSSWAERGFCSTCGSGLFYRLKETGMTVMHIGLFDDPAPFKLTGEIFTDNKLPGFDFAGDHERLTDAQTMARFQEQSAQ